MIFMCLDEKYEINPGESINLFYDYFMYILDFECSEDCKYYLNLLVL